MDYWSSKGRHVLIAALEAVCDTVEGDLAAEIQQRDDDRHASLLEEINILKTTAARVDDLEKENQVLILDLDELRRNQVLQDVKSPQSSPASGECAPSTARPALARVSADGNIGTLGAGPSADGFEEPTWEKKYTKLAMKHVALEKRHDETRRSAMKYRESRESWTKYALSVEAKVKRLEKRLQRNENTDGRLLAPSEAKPQTARAAPDDALGSGSDSSPPPAISPPPLDGAIEESINRENTTPTPTSAMPGYTVRSRDEAMQDGSEGADELPSMPPGTAAKPAAAIKQEPSSDAPVVVSERTIRKRKHTEDEAGMTAPARRIKSDQSTSSDPVITGEVPLFCPHESIDLDDEDQGMPTPRKQRPSEHQGLREEDEVTPAKDEVSIEQHFAGARSRKNELNTPSRDLSTHPDRPAAAVLSTHQLSRTYGDSHRSPIKAGWTLSSGIADVAEETVESFYSPSPRHAAGKGPAHQTPAQGRLHSLLNHGSPKKTAGFLSPTPARRDYASPHLDKENIDDMPPEKDIRPRQDAPVKTSPAVKASPATSLRRSFKDKGNPAKPSRLRERTLAELRPEDFKVNPKSNNGYRYAFDEVVRNREERSELAGCTDPNCCGKQFRVMAESELSAGGPGILSRVADVKMMENYLGNEAYRLVDMTRAERQDMWLKAKIQDLADRYGRHRHRFARKPSPPGYWNPDFPSTQEIEQSKEEAERLERGLVEERWREAMRGGGRWLFRDE
ncbi:DNA repair protein endonuclease SAE2/CtIP C-terminus-domain-containing protein [Chaetomidium leptoderma]|uniref:DNA repair protein endonuclease SAE2/CtIP C-terminus-domain-containing protein n=1 Tax=Chaetomidium leptoderma TaxID=669021 RepID=A0AAN6VXT8_9PEZI|nr:DNA repair protein endonuclease SAE2/CtIP C-terminus-domain-containing protein [Chaetomidium leptoderma]